MLNISVTKKDNLLRKLTLLATLAIPAWNMDDESSIQGIETQSQS